jgi:hypothetical protein
MTSRMLFELLRLLLSTNVKVKKMTTVHIRQNFWKVSFKMAAIANQRCQSTKTGKIFSKWPVNGFEAWKFQNACRCHGNGKNTQFNTKVNNNHTFFRLSMQIAIYSFKMAAIANQRCQSTKTGKIFSKWPVYKFWNKFFNIQHAKKK